MASSGTQGWTGSVGTTLEKISTIAVTTCKESIRQPVFYLLMAVATLLLLLFPFIPYFTFGEDLKMVKDTGLATITVVTLLLGLISASTCIADELEGRTAITLLSKPITRRHFILGKFFGILAAVLIAFLILSVIFALTVYYMVGFEARETSSAGRDLAVSVRLAEIWQILPGIALAFGQVMVLTAIAVAISTRLPMMVNLIMCLGIFVLGHLSPLIVMQAEGGAEVVAFMAKLFALILPYLENCNVSSAVATGQYVPWLEYVLPVAAYCILYTAGALLLALVLFEDRDLA